MKDLPLNHLRALAAVYDAGGIRPAGRQLSVEHSAISRSLRELENWLGIAVVARQPARRTLLLTQEGEALAKAAIKALGELESAVHSAREGPQPNSVSIATTPSFAMRWLLPRLADLATEHPDIEVSIIVDRARNTPADAGADLCIRMGGSWRPNEHSVTLMDEHVFPVLGPKIWDQHGRPRSLAKLAKLTLLHDRDPSTAWSRWRDQFGPKSLDTRPGPRLTSADLVLRAAEQNRGIALARAALASDSLNEGRLIRPIPDSQLTLSAHYRLVTHDKSVARHAVQLVANWLIETARRAQPC
ncbi:MAG: LysR substrate-binding domain-containing protein [Pseudomonadota bacterium]